MRNCENPDALVDVEPTTAVPDLLNKRPLEKDPAPRLNILGVDITDVTIEAAIDRIELMIHHFDGRSRSVYFVNAHTLNTACDDPDYRRVLNGADYVFGDGTGVRWAARLQGVRLQDNVCGTDLTPSLFSRTASRQYSYYLLGTDADSIDRTAAYAREAFPGWNQVGAHHGYVADEELNASVIEQINAAEPDVLLVGMGNPLQEQWIDRHRHELCVPVCMGVGGLFDYWAGNIRRTPKWLRRIGYEWLGLLIQQPRKASRYLIGNPLFLARIAKEAWKRQQTTAPAPEEHEKEEIDVDAPAPVALTTEELRSDVDVPVAVTKQELSDAPAPMAATEECGQPIGYGRWIAKKSARRTMAFFASCTPDARPRVRPRVRVLTYHRFGDCPRDPFCVSQSSLASQMHWLAKNQLAISLDEFHEFLEGNREVADGSVLVTTDDGHRSVHRVMLPVLKIYDIPAVAYVTPQHIARTAGDDEAYMTWDELGELRENRVAVQSHGWTHRSLATLPQSEVDDEALKSRVALEAGLGCEVTSFAYPFGTRADFNELTERSLINAGYKSIFTSQHGAVTSESPASALPRVKVEGGEGETMFRWICRGGLDGWRAVDHMLWKLQSRDESEKESVGVVEDQQTDEPAN